MDAMAASGLSFQASLPLRWQTQCSVSTLEASRYLAVLADWEHSGKERSEEQAELHAKLDLTLLWLARTQMPPLPPAQAATLGLEWISWLATEPLPVGEQGTVALCLSEALPFLLQLPAHITACSAEGAQWRVQAQLLMSDEHLREQWERTVFRRHRRAIVQERGARP